MALGREKCGQNSFAKENDLSINEKFSHVQLNLVRSVTSCRGQIKKNADSEKQSRNMRVRLTPQNDLVG